ncbi:MAG: hypothetical protein FWE53_05115 [Firmicutes bacterium]|nr:hypothetical protein [Bacillota bacterium]
MAGDGEYGGIIAGSEGAKSKERGLTNMSAEELRQELNKAIDKLGESKRAFAKENEELKKKLAISTAENEALKGRLEISEETLDAQVDYLLDLANVFKSAFKFLGDNAETLSMPQVKDFSETMAGNDQDLLVSITSIKAVECDLRKTPSGQGCDIHINFTQGKQDRLFVMTPSGEGRMAKEDQIEARTVAVK